MCGTHAVELEIGMFGYPVQLLGNRALKIIPKAEADVEVDSQYCLDQEVMIFQQIMQDSPPHIVKVFGVHDMGNHWIVEMERLQVLPGYGSSGPDLPTHRNLSSLLGYCNRWRSLKENQTNLKSFVTGHSLPNYQPSEENLERLLDCHMEFYEQLVEARAYMSSKGWEHTDESEHNWMINDYGRVKMIDFDRVRDI